MLGVLTYSHGDVIVDALGQPVHVHQSVSGRQLAPESLLGLCVAHALKAADVVDRNNAGSWREKKNKKRNELMKPGTHIYLVI